MKHLILLSLLISNSAIAQWKEAYIHQQVNAWIQYDTNFFASIQPSDIGTGAGVYKYTSWNYCSNCGYLGKWSARNTGINVGQEKIGMFTSLGRYLYYYHEDNTQGHNGIYRSGDTGKTWHILKGAYPATDESYFFCSYGGWLSRSRDSGSTLDSIAPYIADLLIPHGSLVIADVGTSFIRSLDTGAHWLPLSTPYSSNRKILSYSFIGPVLFAANSSIIRSTDSGTSWTEVSVTGRNTSILASSGSLLFAGTDSNVWVSGDQGATWHCTDEITYTILQPVGIRNIKAIGIFDSLLFVNGRSSDGQYAYTAYRALSDFKQYKDVAPPQVLMLDTVRIYPNPTSKSITVQLGNITATRIEVLNVLGASLQTVTPRQTEVALDLSLLPSGTYFLLIETSKGVIYRKIARV